MHAKLSMAEGSLTWGQEEAAELRIRSHARLTRQSLELEV